MKYFYEDGCIYEVNLIEDGYILRKEIEDLKLYRKEDRVVLVKKKESGLAEILLNLKLKNLKEENNI